MPAPPVCEDPAEQCYECVIIEKQQGALSTGLQPPLHSVLTCEALLQAIMVEKKDEKAAAGAAAAGGMPGGYSPSGMPAGMTM